MPISAVDSINRKSFGGAKPEACQTTEPKKTSYTLLGTVGGLTGYALKNTLPVTNAEKLANGYDSFMKAQILPTAVQKAKTVEEIRKTAKTGSAEAVFVSMVDKFKESNSFKEVKKMFRAQPKQIQENVVGVLEKVNRDSRNLRQLSNYIFETVIKKATRSGPLYITSGVALGVGAAAVNNALNRNDAQRCDCGA